MPNAAMLMIVPLMIWSARTVIDSQAWTSRDDHAAPGSPRRSADEQRHRDARRRPIAAAGTSWPTTTPADQPTKAAVSIMPSMPMLTTPDRSYMTPHSAPSAIGTAAATIDRRDDRQDVDEVADELEDEPEDRDVEEELHRRYFAVCPPYELVIVCSSSMPPASAADPEDAAHDRARRPGRTGYAPAGRRPSGPGRRPGSASAGAAAHGPEQQAGEAGCRPGARGPAARRRSRRSRRWCRRAGMWWTSPRISTAPASPASRPPTDIVRMISRCGRMPA